VYIWAKFLGCPPRAAWARDPSGGNRLPRDFKNRRTVKIERNEEGYRKRERERTLQTTVILTRKFKSTAE